MTTPPPDPAKARLLLVEEIFFKASAEPSERREQVLAALCIGDDALAREVRELLQHAQGIGAFLEAPALGKPWSELSPTPDADHTGDDFVGITLGNFRIERRLASGGMGSVYLASRSDGSFDQKVAVKVVRRGMDSEEILARFRAERQTLAALDHPNIARLIDGGITPDGRPYLAMEYVDGKPIDEYCDAKRLRIPERLRLFRDVCDAVHHAHQNLVIHRDIKPSNILVTDAGVPKLLDFGIAKLLAPDSGQTPATLDTDRRLTPEYASPEQVEGRNVTTATDVYSLGVVLYELLVGARPYAFHTRTHEELRRVVLEVVPPAPSVAATLKVTRFRTGSGGPAPASDNPLTVKPADSAQTRRMTSTRLRSTLRGDLDNIALMALRKEPERRYASAEQLASDISRYLDGLPVRARRDTLAYRASKFLRRHAIGAALSLFAVLALGISAVSLYEQRAQLRIQRDRLVSTNAQLDASREFLLDIISGGETGNSGPDQTLGSLLNDAAIALEQAPPQDSVTRAAAQQALGRAFMSVGELDRAAALFAAAEPVLSTHEGSLVGRTDIRIDLAELAIFQGRPAEAEPVLRQLLADERRANQGSPTLREGLLLNNLGAALRAERRFDDAIAAQREAIKVRTLLLGEDSLPVASSRNNLASSLFQNSDTEGALQEFTRVLAIRTKLLRADHPLIVRCKSNLGLAQFRAGLIEEAIKTLTESVNAWDKAFGPAHPGRVPASTSLALALRKHGQPADAARVLQSALDWQRQHHAPDISIAATEANLALALNESGQGTEAQALLERTIPLLTPVPAQSGIARAACEALASIYDTQGRADDAARMRSLTK